MKMNKKMIWGLGISLIYWIIISLRFDILYGLNDDIMMQSILSGGLSGQPSSMAVYMGQPLTAILAMLYSFAAGIPWLGLFLSGCYILCFILVLCRVLSIAKNRKQCLFGGCVAVLAFTAVCLPQYLIIHYTVVAAVMGATGLFLIGTDETEKKTFLYSFSGYLLLIFCFLIRRQVFLLACPFLLGILFYRFLCDREWKLRLRYFGIFAGIVLLFGMIYVLAYSRNGWKEYSSFNAARTDLYDYTGVWEGDAATAYYEELGLTKEQIAVYVAYDLMLDEQLSTDRVQQMAAFEPGKYGIKSPMEPSLKEALWLYRTGCLSTGQEFPYNYMVLSLYFVLILLSVSRKNWRTFFITVCFGAGRSAIWMYLLLKGRLPERVSVSLYLIEGVTLICILWNLLREKEDIKTPVWQKAVIGAITLLLPLAAVLNMRTTGLRQSELAKQNATDRIIYDYFAEHSENYYLLDVYATVNRTQYALKDKCGERENYLVLGGWITESPLVHEKLVNWGYDSAVDALLHGENVFFVKKENAGLGTETLEQVFEGVRFELQKKLDTGNGTSFLIYRVSH